MLTLEQRIDMYCKILILISEMCILKDGENFLSLTIRLANVLGELEDDFVTCP